MASRRFEDAMAQQVKSGTATHRALDCLEAADLSFHRARTPGQRQGGPDGGQVPSQSPGESGKRRFLSGHKPVIQSILLLLADHRAEVPSQSDEMSQFGGPGDQSIDE